MAKTVEINDDSWVVRFGGCYLFTNDACHPNIMVINGDKEIVGCITPDRYRELSEVFVAFDMAINGGDDGKTK